MPKTRSNDTIESLKPFQTFLKLSPNPTFPEIIEVIRKDLRLTRIEMASKLRVSKTFYDDFLNKPNHNIDKKKSNDWANILGYPETTFSNYV